MKTDSRLIAAAAVVGAAYAALTVLLSPISFGPVQLRLSEVLCVLPFFIPGTAWGLFLGCALANLVTGNVFDVVFGSLATLLAGLITARCGRFGAGARWRFAACSAPVLVNALIVGAVITGAYNGFDPLENLGVYALNALQIALSEAAVLYILGLPFMRWLPKKKFFREFADKINRNKLFRRNSCESQKGYYPGSRSGYETAAEYQEYPQGNASSGGQACSPVHSGGSRFSRR